MAEYSKEGPGNEARPGMPRWMRYAFWGGLSGLASAIAVLFVFTIYYGHVLGLGAESCVIFGCAMTVMMSEPAGVFGLLFGTLAGVLCGVIGHHASR